MQGTITFIVNNIAEPPFIKEHGLSLLLKFNGQRILFDTGKGKALHYNSKELGISLSDLDILILSHGHYDHGGNVAEIINLNPDIHLFAHPNCLVPRWSSHHGKSPKSVALSDKDREAIKNLPDNQLPWCSEATEVMPDIWLTGTIERKNDFEDVGGNFYLDETATTPDLLPDDMSLWIKGPNGLTIVCGCCHSGVKNSVEAIRKSSSVLEIDRLIGGLHLVNANKNRLTKTITFLNNLNISEVVPAHCTGEKTMYLFKERLNCSVAIGSGGLKIKI